MNRPANLRRRSPIAIATAAAVVLVLLGLAYWGYAGYKKRELQDAVAALAVEASSRLREALQVRDSGAEELERLEGHFKALGSATQRLAGFELWRDPPLSDAAQQYLDEAHALLRRQIAVQRSRDAVLADVTALSGHIHAARARSSDWIREAVALKQQLERDFFDYRLAEGGLQKSFQALPGARQQLAPLLAAVPLIEDRWLADARARLERTTGQLGRQLEDARKLPVAR